MKKRLLLTLTVLIGVVSTASALKPVDAQDLGNRSGSRRVVIVSEWSRYKERLIEELVDELDDGQTALLVRSFDDFGEIAPDDYDAVIIINAGVGSEVREPVVTWLNRHSSDDNIVLLTTQIYDWTPQVTVDSVTAASQTRNIPEISKSLADRARSYF